MTFKADKTADNQKGELSGHILASKFLTGILLEDTSVRQHYRGLEIESQRAVEIIVLNPEASIGEKNLFERESQGENESDDSSSVVIEHGTTDDGLLFMIVEPQGSGGPNPVEAKQADQNIWKTAFIILLGITLLTALLVYLTFIRTPEPDTVPADEGALPVQPLPPASGISEQSALVMPLDQSDSAAPTDPLAGAGDGFDPWSRGVPPAGAPSYVPPGGEVVTVPDGNSQFMPKEGPGDYLTPQVSPSPKTTSSPEKDKSKSGSKEKSSDTTKSKTPLKKKD